MAFFCAAASRRSTVWAIACSMLSFVRSTGFFTARATAMIVVPVTSMKNTTISKMMMIFAPVSPNRRSAG